MTRYYFDLYDEEGVWPDEEGSELPDFEAAQVEAAFALAGMAQSEPRGARQLRIAVHVRTAEGPLFEAAFIFNMKPLQ